MAPAVVVSGSGENEEFEGRTTVYVIVCAIIAAFGGLMFGYDIGISASKVCSKAGRKLTMQIASNIFLLGVALTSAGVNLGMIIFGRIFLGFGIEFANQVVPLFLSEIAPARIRGAFTISFQLFITIGILIANLVNYFASNIHTYGWRISLAIAEKSRASRMSIDDEFDSIVHACEMARQVKDPFRKLIKPVSRSPLVIAICLQVFQQFTGINAIMFYAPVLFQTVGIGNDAALLSSVITGLVNVFSTMVSVYLVDRAGRRVLLLEACDQIFISQVIIGIILQRELKPTGDNLSKGEAILVVIMVCIFVMGFSGFAFAVSSNMFFTFAIAQAFLSMLCRMQARIFFFFAGWIIIMGVFT
ncbi:hypothetical protein F3Y22_tig00110450pilonHSYRG00771 [Hibiscus syriacus]|uniref:Major facilitator superfamily (MFS) profile domain-containing protein n=1 Tax=Hibiscus syriacus TaxID=106335 RepID=A0A6A3AL20_HIBSY|nr:hypothetical protein F3Y22_tig00110450pilonHSYRG00771 [Hibiscus syriacus]